MTKVHENFANQCIFYNSKIQICLNSVIHFLYKTWRGREEEKDEEKIEKRKVEDSYLQHSLYTYTYI